MKRVAINIVGNPFSYILSFRKRFYEPPFNPIYFRYNADATNV